MNKYGLKKVILGLDAGEWLRTRNYTPEENIERLFKRHGFVANIFVLLSYIPLGHRSKNWLRAETNLGFERTT